MAASGGRGVKILPSMPRRRRLESEFRPLLRSHCDRRRQVPEIKMKQFKGFGMIENPTEYSIKCRELVGSSLYRQ